jgi:hypothetical protein
MCSATASAPAGHRFHRQGSPDNRRRLRPQNRRPKRCRCPPQLMEPAQFVGCPTALGTNGNDGIIHRGAQRIAKSYLILGFGQDDAARVLPFMGRIVQKLLELDRRRNLRRRDAPRLFCRLPRDPHPAFLPFDRHGSQVRVSSPRNQRNYLSDPNLSALLNRPLHAIELEDGENQSQLRRRASRHLFSKRELYALIRDRRNSAAPHSLPDSDIEFLSDLRPQNAGEVNSVLAGQCSGVSMNFIGNPASAGQKPVLSSQLQSPSPEQISQSTTFLLRTESQELRTALTQTYP